jgi:hypothetical protein
MGTTTLHFGNQSLFKYTKNIWILENYLILLLNLKIYIYFIYLSEYKIFFTEIIGFVEKTKTSYGCYNNKKKKSKIEVQFLYVIESLKSHMIKLCSKSN